MPLPPWSVELLRRSLSDVASKASPETIEKLKSQATAILNELPAAAARGVDSVMQATESTRQSVQTWARSYTATSRPVINATGFLSEADGSSPPIHAEVLEAGMEFLDGSRLNGPGLERLVVEALQRLKKGSVVPADTGKGADNAKRSGLDLDDAVILVTGSIESALLCLGMTAARKTLRLHRSQAVTFSSGRSIPDVLRGAGFDLEEFGGVDQLQAEQFEDDAEDVFLFADGGTCPRPVPRLVSKGRRVDLLPMAAWCTADLPDKAASFPTVQGCVEQGIDGIAFSPSPLAGGPRCGVLVVRSKDAESVKKSALWPVVKADEVTRAMALTSLANCPLESSGSAASLMTLSIENLQSRAEKLKTRLEACQKVESVDVKASVAGVHRRIGSEVDSRAVHVSLRSDDREQCLNRLRQGEAAVYAAIEGSTIVLDLRWVSPSDDSRLASSLESVFG